MGREERRERRKQRREERHRKEQDAPLAKEIVKHVVKSVLIPHHAIPAAIHIMDNVKLGKKIVEHFTPKEENHCHEDHMPSTPQYTPSAPDLRSTVTHP